MVWRVFVFKLVHFRGAHKNDSRGPPAWFIIISRTPGKFLPKENSPLDYPNLGVLFGWAFIIEFALARFTR